MKIRIMCFIFLGIISTSMAQWTKVSTQNVGLSGRLHSYNSTLFLYGSFGGYHLYKSTDNGTTWTDIISKFPYDVYYLFNYKNEIFALTGNSGKSIYSSNDGGETWAQKSSIPTVTGNGAILWMTSDGDKLYAVSNRKSFYTSTDNGLTWKETIINTNSGGNMSYFAASGNTMVSVIVGTGAVVSTDGGQTWVINNPGNPSLFVTYVINFNSSVYGITSGSGVHKFNSTSKTWESVSNGLPDALSFQISKAFLAYGNTLYVATIGFLDSKVSIYFSSDNGANWSSMSTSGLLALNTATSSTSFSLTPQNIFFYDYNDTNGASLYKLTNNTTGIMDNAKLPYLFELSQNYPNPFNPSTTISFSIPQVMVRQAHHDNADVIPSLSGDEVHVTLKVYDVLGREEATLVNENLSAGSYSYNFDARNLTSGVYLYKLQAGKYSETKKMILMK